MHDCHSAQGEAAPLPLPVWGTGKPAPAIEQATNAGIGDLELLGSYQGAIRELLWIYYGTIRELLGNYQGTIELLAKRFGTGRVQPGSRFAGGSPGLRAAQR